jgi:hypothetical protein
MLFPEINILKLHGAIMCQFITPRNYREEEEYLFSNNISTSKHYTCTDSFILKCIVYKSKKKENNF